MVDVIMAFDEKLADRIRKIVKGKRNFSEKKMFGGLAFMLKGKMCCGIQDDQLVARIGGESYEIALKEPHVRPMDFTGRPMKGYIYVGAKGLKTHGALMRWIGQSITFTSMLKEKKK